MVRVSQLTQAQKLLLAVSLPVTLVFMYFLFRKNEEDDEDESESRTGASRFVAIEVNVPAGTVGAVIGSQGSQIKSIQEATRTQIRFKGDRNAAKDTDRVLVIRGTQEGIHQAELMVRKIIVDQPTIIADVLTVPCEAIGRIIGRNGDTIRSMSQQSKAKITIERTELRAKSDVAVPIQLRGSQAAIEIAKSLILDKVAEEKEFRVKKCKEEGKACRISDVGTTSESAVESTQLGMEYRPVYVSAVEHPEHFWVQVLSLKSTQLDMLVENMTEFYGKKNLGEPVTDLHEGDLVAAPFEHDDRWYRTEVAHLDGDNVDLYYVDFGDSSYVSKDCVKVLRNDFMNLPHQAVECCLADVKPSQDTEWNSSAVDLFEELSHTAKWKSVMARIVGSRRTSYGATIPCIQLVDTNGPMDVDIAVELVRRGQARFESSRVVGDKAPHMNSSAPPCEEIADDKLFGWDPTWAEWFLSDSSTSSKLGDGHEAGENVDGEDINFWRYSLLGSSVKDVNPAQLKRACKRLTSEITGIDYVSDQSVPLKDQCCSCSKATKLLTIPAGLYEGYCDLPDFYARDTVDEAAETCDEFMDNFTEGHDRNSEKLVTSQSAIDTSLKKLEATANNMENNFLNLLRDYPSVKSALCLGHVRSEMHVDNVSPDRYAFARDFPSVIEAVVLGKCSNERDTYDVMSVHENDCVDFEVTCMSQDNAEGSVNPVLLKWPVAELASKLGKAEVVESGEKTAKVENTQAQILAYSAIGVQNLVQEEALISSSVAPNFSPAEIVTDEYLFMPVVSKKHRRRQRQRQLSNELTIDEKVSTFMPETAEYVSQGAGEGDTSSCCVTSNLENPKVAGESRIDDMVLSRLVNNNCVAQFENGETDSTCEITTDRLLKIAPEQASDIHTIGRASPSDSNHVERRLENNSILKNETPVSNINTELLSEELTVVSSSSVLMNPIGKLTCYAQYSDWHPYIYSALSALNDLELGKFQDMTKALSCDKIVLEAAHFTKLTKTTVSVGDKCFNSTETESNRSRTTISEGIINKSTKMTSDDYSLSTTHSSIIPQNYETTFVNYYQGLAMLSDLEAGKVRRPNQLINVQPNELGVSSNSNSVARYDISSGVTLVTNDCKRKSSPVANDMLLVAGYPTLRQVSEMNNVRPRFEECASDTACTRSEYGVSSWVESEYPSVWDSLEIYRRLNTESKPTVCETPTADEKTCNVHGYADKVEAYQRLSDSNVLCHNASAVCCGGGTILTEQLKIDSLASNEVISDETSLTEAIIPAESVTWEQSALTESCIYLERVHDVILTINKKHTSNDGSSDQGVDTKRECAVDQEVTGVACVVEDGCKSTEKRKTESAVVSDEPDVAPHIIDVIYDEDTFTPVVSKKLKRRQRQLSDDFALYEKLVESCHTIDDGPSSNDVSVERHNVNSEDSDILTQSIETTGESISSDMLKSSVDINIKISTSDSLSSPFGLCESAVVETPDVRIEEDTELILPSSFGSFTSTVDDLSRRTISYHVPNSELHNIDITTDDTQIMQSQKTEVEPNDVLYSVTREIKSDLARTAEKLEPPRSGVTLLCSEGKVSSRPHFLSAVQRHAYEGDNCKYTYGAIVALHDFESGKFHETIDAGSSITGTNNEIVVEAVESPQVDDHGTEINEKSLANIESSTNELTEEVAYIMSNKVTSELTEPDIEDEEYSFTPVVSKKHRRRERQRQLSNELELYEQHVVSCQTTDDIPSMRDISVSSHGASLEGDDILTANNNMTYNGILSDTLESGAFENVDVSSGDLLSCSSGICSIATVETPFGKRMQEDTGLRVPSSSGANATDIYELSHLTINLNASSSELLTNISSEYYDCSNAAAVTVESADEVLSQLANKFLAVRESIESGDETSLCCPTVEKKFETSVSSDIAYDSIGTVNGSEKLVMGDERLAKVMSICQVENDKSDSSCKHYVDMTTDNTQILHSQKSEVEAGDVRSLVTREIKSGLARTAEKLEPPRSGVTLPWSEGKVNGRPYSLRGVQRHAYEGDICKYTYGAIVALHDFESGKFHKTVAAGSSTTGTSHEIVVEAVESPQQIDDRGAEINDKSLTNIESSNSELTEQVADIVSNKVNPERSEPDREDDEYSFTPVVSKKHRRRERQRQLSNELELYEQVVESCMNTGRVMSREDASERVDGTSRDADGDHSFQAIVVGKSADAIDSSVSTGSEAATNQLAAFPIDHQFTSSGSRCADVDTFPTNNAFFDDTITSYQLPAIACKLTEEVSTNCQIAESETGSVYHCDVQPLAATVEAMHKSILQNVAPRTNVNSTSTDYSFAEGVDRIHATVIESTLKSTMLVDQAPLELHESAIEFTSTCTNIADCDRLHSASSPGCFATDAERQLYAYCAVRALRDFESGKFYTNLIVTVPLNSPNCDSATALKEETTLLQVDDNGTELSKNSTAEVINLNKKTEDRVPKNITSEQSSASSNEYLFTSVNCKKHRRREKHRQLSDKLALYEKFVDSCLTNNQDASGKGNVYTRDVSSKYIPSVLTNASDASFDVMQSPVGDSSVKTVETTVETTVDAHADNSVPSLVDQTENASINGLQLCASFPVLQHVLQLNRIRYTLIDSSHVTEAAASYKGTLLPLVDDFPSVLESIEIYRQAILSTGSVVVSDNLMTKMDSDQQFGIELYHDALHNGAIADTSTDSTYTRSFDSDTTWGDNTSVITNSLLESTFGVESALRNVTEEVVCNKLQTTSEFVSAGLLADLLPVPETQSISPSWPQDYSTYAEQQTYTFRALVTLHDLESGRLSKATTAENLANSTNVINAVLLRDDKVPREMDSVQNEAGNELATEQPVETLSNETIGNECLFVSASNKKQRGRQRQRQLSNEFIIDEQSTSANKTADVSISERISPIAVVNNMGLSDMSCCCVDKAIVYPSSAVVFSDASEGCASDEVNHADIGLKAKFFSTDVYKETTVAATNEKIDSTIAPNSSLANCGSCVYYKTMLILGDIEAGRYYRTKEESVCDIEIQRKLSVGAESVLSAADSPDSAVDLTFYLELQKSKNDSYDYEKVPDIITDSSVLRTELPAAETNVTQENYVKVSSSGLVRESVRENSIENSKWHVCDHITTDETNHCTTYHRNTASDFGLLFENSQCFTSMIGDLNVDEIPCDIVKRDMRLENCCSNGNVEKCVDVLESTSCQDSVALPTDPVTSVVQVGTAANHTSNDSVIGSRSRKRKRQAHKPSEEGHSRAPLVNEGLVVAGSVSSLVADVQKLEGQCPIFSGDNPLAEISSSLECKMVTYSPTIIESSAYHDKEETVLNDVEGGELELCDAKNAVHCGDDYASEYSENPTFLPRNDQLTHNLDIESTIKNIPGYTDTTASIAILKLELTEIEDTASEEKLIENEFMVVESKKHRRRRLKSTCESNSFDESGSCTVQSHGEHDLIMSMPGHIDVALSLNLTKLGDFDANNPDVVIDAISCKELAAELPRNKPLVLPSSEPLELPAELLPATDQLIVEVEDTIEDLYLTSCDSGSVKENASSVQSQSVCSLNQPYTGPQKWSNNADSDTTIHSISKQRVSDKTPSKPVAFFDLGEERTRNEEVDFQSCYLLREVEFQEEIDANLCGHNGTVNVVDLNLSVRLTDKMSGIMAVSGDNLLLNTNLCPQSDLPTACSVNRDLSPENVNLINRTSSSFAEAAQPSELFEEENVEQDLALSVSWLGKSKSVAESCCETGELLDPSHSSPVIEQKPTEFDQQAGSLKFRNDSKSTVDDVSPAETDNIIQRGPESVMEYHGNLIAFSDLENSVACEGHWLTTASHNPLEVEDSNSHKHGICSGSSVEEEKRMSEGPLAKSDSDVLRINQLAKLVNVGECVRGVEPPQMPIVKKKRLKHNKKRKPKDRRGAVKLPNQQLLTDLETDRNSEMLRACELTAVQSAMNSPNEVIQPTFTTVNQPSKSPVVYETDRELDFPSADNEMSPTTEFDNQQLTAVQSAMDFPKEATESTFTTVNKMSKSPVVYEADRKSSIRAADNRRSPKTEFDNRQSPFIDEQFSLFAESGRDGRKEANIDNSVDVTLLQIKHSPQPIEKKRRKKKFEVYPEVSSDVAESQPLTRDSMDTAQHEKSCPINHKEVNLISPLVEHTRDKELGVSKEIIVTSTFENTMTAKSSSSDDQLKSNPTNYLLGKARTVVEEKTNSTDVPCNEANETETFVSFFDTSVSDINKGTELKATKKHKRKKQAKKKPSSSNESVTPCDTDLSFLLSQIASICSSDTGNDSPSVSCTNPDSKVQESSEIAQQSIVKSRPLKKYTRTRACKLPIGGSGLAEHDARLIENVVRGIENADNDIEETEIMLAVSTSVKMPYAADVVDSRDCDKLAISKHSTPLPALDRSFVEQECQLNTDSEELHAHLSLASDDNLLLPCTEATKKSVTNSDMDFPEQGTSSTIPSPSSEDEGAIFDRSADSEVERILAGGLQCVPDVDEGQSDGTDSIEGQAASSSGSTSNGSSMLDTVGDETVITEYLDVEIVEETETVTVVESIYDPNGSISPASTVCDETGEGSNSFYSVPDLELDVPAIDEANASDADDHAVRAQSVSDFGSEKLESHQQMEYVDRANENLALSSDAVPSSTAAEPANSVALAVDEMFYPQWLEKAAPPRQHLMTRTSGVSRKRLHSFDNVDSDYNEDPRGLRRTSLKEADDNVLHFLISQHHPQINDSSDSRQMYAGQSFVLHDDSRYSRPTFPDDSLPLHSFVESPGWIFADSDDVSRRPTWVAYEETGGHVDNVALPSLSGRFVNIQRSGDQKYFDDSLEEDDCLLASRVIGGTTSVAEVQVSPSVGPCISRVMRSEERGSELSETCSTDSLDFFALPPKSSNSFKQHSISSPDKFSDDSLTESKARVVPGLGLVSQSCTANAFGYDATCSSSEAAPSSKTKTKSTRSRDMSSRSKKTRKK